MFINVPATFTITRQPLGDHLAIGALLNQGFKSAPHQIRVSSSRRPKRIVASLHF